MEAGDFGVVFPNRIHHYQAFGGPGGRALFLLAPASMLSPFGNEWQQRAPRNPVIRRENVPADIVNAVYRLFESKKEERAVRQAYVQERGLSWLINQIRYAVPCLRAYKAQLHFPFHGAEKADPASKDSWDNGDVVPANQMFPHKLPDDISPAADPDVFSAFLGQPAD